jgi:hypothetical protein
VGMILSSWNKFLRSLLYVVVKSNNNEGLVRTIHFELGRLRLIIFHLNDRRKKENKRKNMCKRKKTCAISPIGILTTALWTHVLSMFVCAVIHINHHTSLELRYGHADCAPWCRALIVSNYSLAFFF